MELARREILKALGVAPLLVTASIINPETVFATDDFFDKKIELVKEYCTLDFEGSWLRQCDTYNIFDYVNCRNFFGYDTIVVVNSYEIRQAFVEENSFFAEVVYDVLGRIEGKTWFSTKDEIGKTTAKKKIYFNIDNCYGEDRIISYHEPHVSLNSTLKHLASIEYTKHKHNERHVKRRDIGVLLSKLNFI